MQTTRPKVAFVPCRHYDTLVAFLEERGVTRTTTLARAGLTPNRLSRDDGLLTIDEVESLSLAAAKLLPDRALGLSLGRKLNVGSHGALGLAGLTAETLDAAVRVAQRYFRLVTPLLALDYERGESVARIGLRSVWPLDARVERFHVETILGSLHAQASFLLGTMPKGVEVDLAYGFSGDLPTWIVETSPHVAFDRPTHELRVPSALLSTRIPLADAKAHAAACRSCDEMLAALPKPDQLSSAVRALLTENGPPFPDLDAVAKKLGVSSRTLRRRLAEEGSSFREVLDSVRVALAESWLRRGDRSITAIGLELGYADAANFSRAFRRVRGMSPQSFQRTARAQ